MTAPPLTTGQRQTLDAVRTLWARLGHSPSQQEVADETGIGRVQTRTRLHQLAEAGYLRIPERGHARGIVLLERDGEGVA